MSEITDTRVFTRLSPDLAKRFSERLEAEGVTESELVRRAVAAYLTPSEPQAQDQGELHGLVETCLLYLITIRKLLNQIGITTMGNEQYRAFAERVYHDAPDQLREVLAKRTQERER